jgi:uncharacterized protein YndB with AHSA1/START domain
VIVKSVVLECSRERAFRLFTEHAGMWWPEDRRHTDDDASEIRIEPSGRFFERARNGTEVALGVVRAFDPDKRLLLDWYPGTSSAHPTRVEVIFESVDDGTKVTIVHGPGLAGAELYGRNAATFDRSWDTVLAAYEKSTSSAC